MIISPPPDSQTQDGIIGYSDRTIIRAQRALSCSSFRLQLFTAMHDNSIPLPEIAGNSGLQKGYTKHSLTETKVESEIMWLIKVGLLRREVDGQGITDSFRLTPLGRQIITKWEHIPGNIPQPSWLDRIINICSRWLRFS